MLICACFYSVTFVCIHIHIAVYKHVNIVLAGKRTTQIMVQALIS